MGQVGKLPLLERVCVQSYATHSFFEALVYKTEAANRSKTAYRKISFSKIRYILVDVNDFDGEIVTFPGMYISVDTLLDCLMERCERNAEVQVLRLKDCYSISSDDVKENVVDVIWDGLEHKQSRHHDSEEYRYYDDLDDLDFVMNDDLDYEMYDDFSGSVASY